MAGNSSIEWTEATWNPVAGCTRASPGCDHCYAVTMTHRLEAMEKQRGATGADAKYTGLTVLNGKGDRHFNGVVRTVADDLAIPLGWKKPRRVFVNSMSDLFHRDVPFGFIDQVFAVMALCPQHTFQILTKRPERMAEYLNERFQIPAHMAIDGKAGHWEERDDVVKNAAMNFLIHSELGDEDRFWTREGSAISTVAPWPLRNVWLGTSVEDQPNAEKRIGELLRCPAAVRFLSVEPMLGAIDLSHWLRGWSEIETGKFHTIGTAPSETALHVSGIDWVIVGGESGPGARPFDVLWAEEIINQCRAAGVPVFLKQLGSMPMLGDSSEPHGWPTKGGPVNWEDGCIHLKSQKGGDPDEWPRHLRVRQFPHIGPEAMGGGSGAEPPDGDAVITSPAASRFNADERRA